MFRRPFIPAALLFILGIFIAAYNVNLIIVALLCLTVCIFVFLKIRNPIGTILLAFLIFLGIFRMEIALQEKNRTEAEYSGRKAETRLVLSGFPDGNSVTAYFTDGSGKHKLLLRCPSVKGFSPGDIIEGEISLSVPKDYDKASLDYARYLEGNNIFLLGYADALSFTGEREGGFMGMLYSLRTYMDTLGEKFFFSDSRGLYNAMIAGDKRLLSDRLSDSLQASGLNHIAVVSGMHLSVAMAFLSFLSGFVFGQRRAGYVFVFIGAIILTILTGAGASVVRALLMCFLSIIAKLFQRDNDPPTALCFAAVVMILANPFMIFNAGFILSVLSVTGILIFNEAVLGFLSEFLPRKLAGLLSLSISAQLLVMPALIFYFGTVAPYSLLSNALLGPVSGVYVISGLLFVILSPIAPLAQLVSFIMKFLSDATIIVCHWIKTLPFSLIETSGDAILFTVLCAFTVVVFYLRRLRGKILK